MSDDANAILDAVSAHLGENPGAVASECIAERAIKLGIMKTESRLLLFNKIVGGNLSPRDAARLAAATMHQAHVETILPRRKKPATSR